MVCVYPLLHAISEKLAIHASFFLIKKIEKNVRTTGIDGKIWKFWIIIEMWNLFKKKKFIDILKINTVYWVFLVFFG